MNYSLCMVFCLACLPVISFAQQQPPLPEIRPEIHKAADFFAEEANSMWFGRLGPVTASASLPAASGSSYGPANLHDFLPGTAWAVPAGGIGQSVTWRFAQAWSDEVYAFNGKIAILNGYAKSEALFMENNRVRSLVVYYNGRLFCRLALADSRELQVFDISSLRSRLPARKANDIFCFRIESIYKGTKYNDTCLSEMLFGSNGN